MFISTASYIPYTYTVSNLRRVLYFLEKIREQHPDFFDEEDGICDNMIMCSGNGYHGWGYPPIERAWDTNNHKWFATWEHFSGDYDYPVPATLTGNDHSSDDMFNNTGNMGEGEYGALRVSLLDHVIKEVRQAIIKQIPLEII